MEKKETENVKLIGTWLYSILRLFSGHLSLRYSLYTIFLAKSKKKRKKRNVFVKNNS